MSGIECDAMLVTECLEPQCFYPKRCDVASVITFKVYEPITILKPTEFMLLEFSTCSNSRSSHVIENFQLLKCSNKCEANGVFKWVSVAILILSCNQVSI